MSGQANYRYRDQNAFGFAGGTEYSSLTSDLGRDFRDIRRAIQLDRAVLRQRYRKQKQS